MESLTVLCIQKDTNNITIAEIHYKFLQETSNVFKLTHYLGSDRIVFKEHLS